MTFSLPMGLRDKRTIQTHLVRPAPPRRFKARKEDLMKPFQRIIVAAGRA
jgi:hypothetical protein